MTKKSAIRKRAASSKPVRAVRKTIKAAAPARIPSVTLDGERMYPDEAKKYWANIKRSAS